MQGTLRVQPAEAAEGFIDIETPYNEAFVEDLKKRIPWDGGQGRTWTGQAWRVAAQYEDEVNALIQKHYHVDLDAGDPQPSRADVAEAALAHAEPTTFNVFSVSPEQITVQPLEMLGEETFSALREAAFHSSKAAIYGAGDLIGGRWYFDLPYQPSLVQVLACRHSCRHLKMATDARVVDRKEHGGVLVETGDGTRALGLPLTEESESEDRTVFFDDQDTMYLLYSVADALDSVLVARPQTERGVTSASSAFAQLVERWGIEEWARDHIDQRLATPVSVSPNRSGRWYYHWPRAQDQRTDYADGLLAACQDDPALGRDVKRLMGWSDADVAEARTARRRQIRQAQQQELAHAEAYASDRASRRLKPMKKAGLIAEAQAHNVDLSGTTTKATIRERLLSDQRYVDAVSGVAAIRESLLEIDDAEEDQAE
jgi:hypothetical protein